MWVTILCLLGEGGSIMLLGQRNKTGEWKYTVKTNESVFSDFIYDEYLPVNTSTKIFKTWEGAMASLNRFPWEKLYPKEIHKEFKEVFFMEIKKKNTVWNRQWEILLHKKRDKRREKNE